MSDTLVELLQARAATGGPSLRYLLDGETDEQEWTYADLDRQARAVAATLQQHAAPGERALLLFAPGMETAVAFFGALYAGLVPVPLEPPRPGQPFDGLLAQADDAAPSVLMTSALIAQMFGPLLAQVPLLAALPVVAVDAVETAPGDWAPHRPEPEALATLLYTSGSTSRPKGVVMSHEHLMARLQSTGEAAQRLATGLPTVSWMPFHHIMGLFSGVLQPLYTRLPAVILSPLDVLERPARWLQAISRYGAGSSSAPNFGFQLAVDQVSPAEREGLDLSSWRTAVLAAETIRLDTLDAFAEAYAPYGFDRRAFFTTYGMSEGGGTGTLYDPTLVPFDHDEAAPLAHRFARGALEAGRAERAAPSAADARVLVTCGPPVPQSEVVIVDPDTRTACPDDTVGEVWMRGAFITDGYWRQPEATAETFGNTRADTGEDGYLRSGDLGFFHDGGLYITGRLKEMLLVRGQNLYAVDLEGTAAQAHPALSPTAVATFSVTVDGDEQLVFAAELPPEAEGESDAVASAVRRAVGEAHQLPVHAVVFVEAGGLPRTRSGKLQRLAARQHYLDAVAAA